MDFLEYPGLGCSWSYETGSMEKVCNREVNRTCECNYSFDSNVGAKECTLEKCLAFYKDDNYNYAVGCYYQSCDLKEPKEIFNGESKCECSRDEVTRCHRRLSSGLDYRLEFDAFDDCKEVKEESRKSYECKCSQQSFNGTNGEAQETCGSEYNGFKWCYIDSTLDCYDWTPSSSFPDRQWSYGACYTFLQDPGPDCFWINEDDQDGNAQSLRACRRDTGCDCKNRTSKDSCIWYVYGGKFNHGSFNVCDEPGSIPAEIQYSDSPCDDAFANQKTGSCEGEVVSVGRAPVLTTAIAATSSNFQTGDKEPCKCSKSARVGNCRRRHRGYLWCFVDNPTNCRDYTYHEASRKFWSFSACYLE